MSKELIQELLNAYAYELVRKHNLSPGSQAYQKLTWAITEACNAAYDV